MAAEQAADMQRLEELEERQEVVVVEEVEDESVGEMLAKDARRTAGYLSAAVRDLRDRMIVMYDKGTNRGYQRQYAALNDIGRNQSVADSQSEENKLKNRYANISPYDKWRVHLPVINDDPCSNYINASWIDGYKSPSRYIASQGPVPNSFISHWRMIWEFQVQTIVMVTHEVEQGRMKCHRYWPDPTSSPPVNKLNYGQIMVYHEVSVQHRHFIVRKFRVEVTPPPTPPPLPTPHTHHISSAVLHLVWDRRLPPLTLILPPTFCCPHAVACHPGARTLRSCCPHAVAYSPAALMLSPAIPCPHPAILILSPIALLPSSCRL